MMVSSRVMFPALLLLSIEAVCRAWQQCEPESGGGFCPDDSTCCPTRSDGISSCIPMSAKDPKGALGKCCDLQTGCGYGFECGLDELNDPYCQMEKDAPEYVHNNTNRYGLCNVPVKMQQIIGFPMGDAQAAYYSNLGDLLTPRNAHLAVEQVLVVVHGSGRDADSYFCAALSLLNEAELEHTLVIAPFFAAPSDGVELKHVLVWAEGKSESHPIMHSWRYGADALNAPISSYAVLDAMIEHLASATFQFPKLRRVAVAGHSAGGQVAHRWGLLSNSPAWRSIPHIEVVVANPRSYCYLDARRIVDDGTFAVPDADSIDVCSSYNEWQWGLDEGSYLPCPYKEQALSETPAEAMAVRYAKRNVAYLSGEFDTLQTHDRCETFLFQGTNRQERAKNYVQGLEEYFGRPTHDFHIITGSPHDHTLMFQSPTAKQQIFGGIEITSPYIGEKIS